MALTEQVQLDISQAQRQINTLETQLDTLSKPIDVPIDIKDVDTAQFDRIAQALGISEQQAAEMAGELREGISASSKLDNDLREVARSLGLSEKEAGDFVRQMRRAEDAAEDTSNAMLRVGTRGVSAFSNLRGSILGVGAAFVAFQGARAFLDFAGDAISAASDLEESTSKVSVVFGDFADDIQQFASTAPQALGLANAQALEFTGTFGNLFVALGLSQQAAAQLAPEIVQLGADLASFNNIEVTEALDKLRAGLVGEAEPLRVLGVNLTAAATAAKAVELGLAASTTEVSEAAKVQARYALILEQTTTAQGDFARTADGIANRQRTLNAEFENFRAAIGEALLPAFEQLLDIAPEIISALEDGLVPAIASVSSAFASVETEGFTRTIAGLPSAVGSVVSGLDSGGQALANFQQGLFAIVTLQPDKAVEQFGQALDDLSDISVGQQINQSIQDLLTTIQGGAAPISAFESVLADLAGGALPTDRLEDFAEQLAAIAGIGADDAAGLFDLSRRIAGVGEDFGFTADEVDALVRAILGVARGGVDPADVALQRFRTQVTETGDEAETATPKITGFSGAVATLGNLDPNLDLNLDIESEIAELESQFDRLPTAFDAVREAFRDDENEIVDDFSTFASDLEAELEAQLAFFQNIDLLRSLGFDDLADRFLDLGIESAELLADGLADPSALGRAESAIDAYEVTIDRGLRQATADVVSDAISNIDDLFDALALIENISIRGSVFLSLTGPGAEFANSVGVGSTGTSDLVGGTPVTVNQTFTSPVTPSTEAARAAQAVNSLVGGPE